jgi:arylformamidase
MKWIFLSHELNQKTPSYGGRNGFEILENREINGDSSSRAQTWKFPNHLGTHVDFPAHFLKEGKTLSDYHASGFIFRKVGLMEVKVEDGHLIEPTHLTWPKEMAAMDLLLIKTGFESRRHLPEYVFQGPGLHPDTCSELRKSAPALRGIGFDFISLTSFQHREAGREAHRILLGGQGMFIVEDMCLGTIDRTPEVVILSPLRVTEADGSPATVFAQVGI